MSSIEERFYEDIAEGPALVVVPETYEQMYVRGLRELADFIEANPKLRPWNGSFWVSVADDETSTAVAKLQEAAKLMAPCTKKANEWNFGLDKKFPGGISLIVEADREQVCERVKTGEHTEKALDVEGLKTLTGLSPEELPMTEKVVEDFEWKCPPSLLGHDG